MPNKYRRVLVTGGCGFVGREVVSLLLANGYDVVVADDLSNPQSRVESGYKFYQIDIGNLGEAHKVFEGVDACVALASRRGAIGFVYRNPTEILIGNNNIYNGTFNAAADAKIRRLVFISSSMVYECSPHFPSKEAELSKAALPVSVFAFSKLMGEQYCKAFHQQHELNYTIIRPSNVYGPEEVPGEKVGDAHVIPDLFKKITSGEYPISLLGNGKQTRSFIHVKDIARGIVTALENEGAANEDFNMGGSEEIQIFELAKMIWALCGIKKEFQFAHHPGFPQDVQRQFLDTAKARNLLEWCPEINFRDGLREAITALKNTGCY